MANYEVEAQGNIQNCVITCGARVGYEGDREVSLDEVIVILGAAHKEVAADNILIPIPCIVREGTLVGRSEGMDYTEKVYSFNFARSPRLPEISDEVFEKSIYGYAFRLGEKMGQEKVYLDYKGRTTVFRIVE